MTENRRIGLGTLVLSVLVLIASPLAGHAEPGNCSDWASQRNWPGLKRGGGALAGLLGRTAAPPELPFSFLVDGEPSGDWLGRTQPRRSVVRAGDAREDHTVTYRDPATGLALRYVLTIYHDFPALEWRLEFENTGPASSPLIENIQPLDATFQAAREPTEGGPFLLRYARGSHDTIEDFAPLETPLDREVCLAPYGGRSSDGYLPFFNIVRPGGAGGMLLGIGWTGQWAACWTPLEDGSLRVRAGMERTHLRLEPGEQIRTPAILVLFWKGDDPLAGQNLMRRLLMAHYYPQRDGKPAPLPISASPYSVIGFGSDTEANMIEGIENVTRNDLPVDTWWMDTGWFTCGDNWARAVGNWEPDPARYPRGLKPVADAAQAHGLKFLLWFEPERVMPGTWMAQNHPEWLLAPTRSFPPELQYEFNDGFHLFDLGNPQARQWLTNKVSAVIDQTGIDVYRQDFNMMPLPYWRQEEAEDRQGMREIRYVSGLYAFTDELLARHPNLLIDTCASGGRRMDFEMLRRSAMLWRSDKCWDLTAQQAMTCGLAQWLPMFGVGAVSADPYAIRSGLGLNFGATFDLYHNPAVWPEARRQLQQYRAIRPLLAGDFYPLTAYGLSPSQWMAWQIDSPSQGAGMVQTFRREQAPTPSESFPLRGLEPAATYSVTDLDHEAAPVRRTGQELMTDGLTVQTQTAPEARIFRYEKER